MAGMFRNLWMGLGLGASMIVGGFLGMAFTTHTVGRGHISETYAWVQGTIIGTILGGVIWKVVEIWRKRTPPIH